MKVTFRVKTSLFSILLCLVLVGSSMFITGIEPVQALVSNDYVPVKWAVIVLGGFDYYRDLRVNAIQRIEKIVQGRGVPYDIFRDDDIVSPTDNPPSGRYALQYANGTLKYQALVLLFDYEPTDSSAVNQNYIYWAAGNGTNVVLFNRVARAVPALLGLVASDVGWSQATASSTMLRITRTFNDGIKEYVKGSSITIGTNLYYNAIIRRNNGMTLWFNKTWSTTWSLGMANTTYYQGNIWYLGYSMNEWAMESTPSTYVVSWDSWGMASWGHAMNFAFNNAERIPVKIMPYKRWKGAWILRLDMDRVRWPSYLIPPESVLQSGWTFDYQFNVLGAGRTSGYGSDLALTNGAPTGYIGIPSSKVMYTDVTGVLQTGGESSRTYRAIIYNSTRGGNYDRIRLDFNGNRNFADDTQYKMWENMTYPTVQGKLYWAKIAPDLVQPRSIDVAWWQTPMLFDNEAANLPILRQYGADYGLSYSFHGWQHVRLEGSSSYAMWNGTRFLLNTTYIGEKFNAARYWMKDKFSGSGYGFEENEVVISHPFNVHPAEVDSVIDSLPWVLFQYPEPSYFVGFGVKSATSKYLLSSNHDEYIDQAPRFAVYEDMVKTLYPVISTYSHNLVYNASYSFQPYSDSIKPANPRDAFHFWLNAKNMLTSTKNAYYKSNRIVLEFTADTALEDYVWRFPVQFNGQQFTSFFDNRSIGQIKHTDASYVYVEFSQGQGPQRLEASYGTPIPTVAVTVSNVSPPNSGTTNPTVGTYTVAENSMFSISATPLSGYTFNHWELDGVNVGSSNPYSFNVTTSSHTISPFFAEIPKVVVTVSGVSPPNSGATSPTGGPYQVPQNSIFQISATPASWYVFDHWELDGINAGSVNPYLFNVDTSDHTVAAFFAAIPTVSVTVSEVSPVNSGTTNPTAGTYTIAENSPFSTTATPLSGYTFDHWELDGVNVGSTNPYSFNVGSSSHTVSAFFAVVPPVVVTVNAVSPLNSGTTNPVAGQYQVAQNSIFQISATPLSGYVFDRWELDGLSVGTQTTYSFNVRASSHIIGAFFRAAPQQQTEQIEGCDSLTGWEATQATLSINNIDFQEGTGSVVVVPAGTQYNHAYATFRKSGFMNFSRYSRLQIWIKVSDASKTLQLMVATDWSNNNVYRITGLTSNTWTRVTIDLSNPTSRTGTVNLSSIRFIGFDYFVQMSSAYFQVDGIRGILR